ncbi:MAG: Sec-independent protein secretion pathway component [Actinobacteria bacterium]|jgi:sec-independent protein translocase protein TatB|nr:Sec-independent protein secretion pathway component [Actinomycetota bacterium]NCU89275.1 Sec-independent protein secretion pathway component [Actinomycetota bacterium]NDA95973.1 Sec-independent protein secretion pathway component [Actinomycetota bacterium]NDE53302.1 Sec-independent protein secretion pathway component [Actinomycetota bacterium]
MFGIGMGEFLGLIVLGLFLVGPDKLPNAAKDFARFLHKVRNFTTYASRELKENLGPGFEDLDVTDLTPKNLAKKVLGNAMDDVTPVVNEVKKQSRDIKDVAKIDPDLL